MERGPDSDTGRRFAEKKEHAGISSMHIKIRPSMKSVALLALFNSNNLLCARLWFKSKSTVAK